MKKQKYHHKDLRSDVLTIATKNIDQLGSASISLRKISAAIGVSPMAVYHHFPSKKDLLMVLAEQYRRELDAKMHIDTDQYTTPKDKLVAMGTLYISYATLFPERFQLMFSSEYTITPQEMMQQQPVLFERFSALVGAHFRLIDPKLFLPMTLSIWSSVHGLATLAVSGPIKNMVKDDESFIKFIDYHLRHIIR